jgi:hypothetical protein
MKQERTGGIRCSAWLGVIRETWTDGWEGKIICAVFGVLAALLLLFGVSVWQWCAALSLKEGVIVDKGHTAAWVQTTFILISDGKNTTMIPQTIYWPEAWSVTIEGNDPKGVHKQRTVSVSREAHDKMELGTTWRVK